jgi:hypothetical protein
MVPNLAFWEMTMKTRSLKFITDTSVGIPLMSW